MSRILNWGVLSTAHINDSVLPAIRESRQSQLYGVASRNLDKARIYAAEWKIPKFYGSYEEMLADPEIDLVYNSLPNHLHAEWTIKAARAGKHVLCEKPIALTPQEVTEIQRAAVENGVHIAEAFMYRHHPQTLKIKEIIQNGQIGEIKLIRGSFSFKMQRPDNYRWNPQFGGGSLWDVGCYPVSYARYLIGEAPDLVFGCQTTAISGIDETFVGQMHYPNGCVAQFDCSFNLPSRTHLEIRGTKGTLIISAPFKPDKRQRPMLITETGWENIPFKSPNLYLGEVDDLVNAVLNNTAPLISLQESRENISTLTALLDSSRKNLPTRPIS